MTKPRILVADDHPGVRKVVANLVGFASEVVGAVDNGKAVVEMGLKLQPDLII